MVLNKQESRRKHWATCSPICSFAFTAHSFACSALPASLARSAALTRSLTSLTLLTLSLVGKCMIQCLEMTWFCPTVQRSHARETEQGNRQFRGIETKRETERAIRSKTKKSTSSNALRSRITKNTGTRAHLLAPPTHSLAPHCSLHARIL